MNKVNSSKERTLYLDVLRIAATVAVIFFHQQGVAENPDIEWSKSFALACSGVTRWCVPVFFMISGSLFLDNSRELTIKKLYCKNILRIVTAFIFWAAVYAIYHYSTPIFFLEGIIMGRYHMWFLLRIVGLYMLTPLLRKITADKKMTEYFLGLSLLFGVCVTTFDMTPLGQIAPGVSGYVFDNIGLSSLAGYAFFYVLGYYLNTFEFAKKINAILITAGFIGCIVSIVISIVSLDVENAPYYYYHFFLPVTLECVAVFLLGKLTMKDKKLSEKSGKVILALSKYSFGVYLIHDLILTIIRPWILDLLGNLPPVAIIVSTSVTALISLAISVVINHIPVLKKYVV